MNPKRGDGNGLRRRQQTHQPFFPGSLEDRAAKLQREAKDNASGNSHDNEKVPMCEDKADAKSPQPESDLPGKVDAHARNESQGDPEAKPSAESSTPQEAPHHSEGDEMALGAQDEPVSPPKVSRSETSFHSAATGSAGREEGKPSVVSPMDRTEEDKHSPIQSKKLFNPPDVTLRTARDN